jgi:predicted MFS family arabinose efflux permease
MDKRLLWLAVGSFAMSTIGFAFSGLLSLIASDVGVSIPQAGYLVTVFSIAYAIGAPVLSTLAGKADRRHVLAAAMLMFVSGNLIAAASSTFFGLLNAQLILGAAAGLFAATAQATAVALVGPDHRARAIAVVMGGTTFAVALGAPISSLIANYWGWRGTFIAVAVLGLFCAAILWMRLPHGMHGARLTLRERLTAVRKPGILLSLAVTFFYLTGGFAIVSYTAPLAIKGAGLPAIAVPGMLLAFGVGAVIGNFCSGYLADRIGATRVVILSLLASAAVSILIALVLKLLPHEISGPLLIALMTLWGAIGWTFPPAQGSRIAGHAPEFAHLTLSLNASAIYFGIAFGTIVGGRVLEFAAPSDLGFFAAAFPLLSLVLLLVSERSRRRASPLAV